MSTTVEQALAGHAQVMESINSWTEAKFAQADSNGPYVLRAAGWPFRSNARACGLDIDYDADLEDEIASAVMRLDELGDLIDGEFRPGRSISCWRHFGPDITECDTRDDGLIGREWMISSP